MSEKRLVYAWRDMSRNSESELVATLKLTLLGFSVSWVVLDHSVFTSLPNRSLFWRLCDHGVRVLICLAIELQRPT